MLVQAPCVVGSIHDSMLRFQMTSALLAFLPRSAPRSSASLFPATASTTDPASRYGCLASVQKIAVVCRELTCSHLVLHFQKPQVPHADARGEFCHSSHGSLASAPKDGSPACYVRLRIELLSSLHVLHMYFSEEATGRKIQLPEISGEENVDTCERTR
jgi:hypothetical protein